MNETKQVMVGHINTLRRRPAESSSQPSGHIPPLLLVHGAWHGAWCWEGNYLDYFAEAGHETWALDLRGHGDSGNTKPLRLTTIGDYIKDVRAVIAEMPEPPVVIGHSMGGFICQHLINENLEVKGFGFLASLPHYGVAGAKLKVHPFKSFLSNITWSLYGLVSNPEHAKYMFLDPGADQETTDRLIDNLGDEAYFALWGMLGFALPKEPAAQKPICVVGGEADTVVFVEHQEKLAERLGVTPHILAGEPHNLMMSKNWEQSAQIFCDWIRDSVVA